MTEDDGTAEQALQDGEKENEPPGGDEKENELQEGDGDEKENELQGGDEAKQDLDDENEQEPSHVADGDDEDDEEDEEEPVMRKGGKGRGKGKGRSTARGKAKAKAKPKAKAKGSARRDQCKSRKFNEIFDTLSGELQSHYNSIRSRDERTKFINTAVLRKGGKLSLDESALFDLVSTREEAQRGKELMTGLIIEDHEKTKLLRA